MKETRPHRLTTRINRCTAASAIFVVASTAFHPPVGPILRLARSLRYIPVYPWHVFCLYRRGHQNWFGLMPTSWERFNPVFNE